MKGVILVYWNMAILKCDLGKLFALILSFPPGGKGHPWWAWGEMGMAGGDKVAPVAFRLGIGSAFLARQSQRLHVGI